MSNCVLGTQTKDDQTLHADVTAMRLNSAEYEGWPNQQYLARV